MSWTQELNPCLPTKPNFFYTFLNVNPIYLKYNRIRGVNFLFLRFKETKKYNRIISLARNRDQPCHFRCHCRWPVWSLKKELYVGWRNDFLLLFQISVCFFAYRIPHLRFKIKNTYTALRKNERPTCSSFPMLIALPHRLRLKFKVGLKPNLISA